MVNDNYCGETEENGPLVGEIGIEGVFVDGWNGTKIKDSGSNEDHKFDQINIPNDESIKDNENNNPITNEVNRTSNKTTSNKKSISHKDNLVQSIPTLKTTTFNTTTTTTKSSRSGEALTITCLSFSHIYQKTLLLLSTDQGTLVKVCTNMLKNE